MIPGGEGDTLRHAHGVKGAAVGNRCLTLQTQEELLILVVTGLYWFKGALTMTLHCRGTKRITPIHAA